jgi:RING-variant domain
MSNPTFESPLLVDLKPNVAPADALIAVDNEAGVKCCRICLEEEDETSMIAPCLCKGSMKWVHRSCLDEWRRNEQDRAFSQCTECHFQYHFMKKEDAPESFWNQPRTKFCLFLSRDIFVVALLLQCLIGLFGLIVMLLDRGQHWNLTHIFDTTDSPYSACLANSSSSSSSSYSSYESTSGATTNVLNATLMYCNHYALAMYYLFGVLTLLATVGLVGTSIFCCNGCRVRSLGDHRGARISGFEALDVPKAPRNSMERGDASTSQDYVSQNDMTERRVHYYREHRRRRRNHADDCCLCCGSAPNYYYHTPNNCCFVYDGVNAGSDCCCCCCDNAANASGGDCCCNVSDHNVSSNDCNCDGDATAVMFFVVLLLFVVMAVVGLFVVLFICVVVCQRIVQRHMFRLQKKQLVHEFQVADLYSGYAAHDVLDGDGATRRPSSSSTLHPNDFSRLKKLGLIVDG